MTFNKMIKTTLAVSLLLGLSACTTSIQGSRYSSNNEGSQKNVITEKQLQINEKLFHSTRNYGKMIDLYRDYLKNNSLSENKKNLYRYKLANAYFNYGDYDSALLYLQPLLTTKDFKQQALELQMKSLVQRGDYNEALKVSNHYIAQYPNVADAYNSQGIAYAQMGDLTKAKASFNNARQNFLNDTVALNNLAMIYILEGKYSHAVNLLLPQYLKGKKDQRLVHNLVYALVKSKDTNYARQIIEKEGLNTQPNALINALKETKHKSSDVVSRSAR